ncbi:hypothetical protein [Kaistia defluvii]|uniref:Uncharacterized protein n=1 Tax=Kaistia defluvii TaxID=410841 RepID=A0ABV2R5Q2_9HYPH
MKRLADKPVAHRALFELASDYETDMRNLRGFAAIIYDALMEVGPLDRERVEGLGFIACELVQASRKMSTLCDQLYELSRVPA